MARGIVIDDEGYVAGIATWSGAVPPDMSIRAIPKKGQKKGRIKKKRVVIDEAHWQPGCENWRWVDGEWMKPTERWTIVDQNGEIVATRPVWPRRAPELPMGQRYVKSAPPNDSRVQCYWDGENWCVPEVKTYQDAEGVTHGPMAVKSGWKPPKGWKEVTNG